MRFARAGFNGRVVDRPSLDLGYTRRNTDHDARFGHDCESFVHLPDEVMEHQLRDVKIADDAVFERPHRDNVRGRSTDHAFGIRAHGERTFGFGIDGHYRWLIDDDALAAHEHERIGRAKIDADVTGEHTHDTVERIAQRHESQ